MNTIGQNVEKSYCIQRLFAQKRTSLQMKAEQTRMFSASGKALEERDEDNRRSVSEIRRALSHAEREQSGQNNASASKSQSSGSVMESILNGMKSYGDSIKTQRQQSKDTSLTKKKLHYGFKNISTQILRTKTSQAARQVVGQASREVLKLKRDKMTGKYDSEEIEAAILHAESMERIAKKKARHLEEEELAKASGASYMEEAAEKSAETGEGRGAEAERFFTYEREEEQTDTVSVFSNESVDLRSEDLILDSEGLPEEIAEFPEDMKELTAELMDAFDQGMRDLMDEMGFGDPVDGAVSGADNLDPEELKELKMKHRIREMKEIAEADSEYLKAVFEHLERHKSGVISPALAENAGVNDVNGIGTDGLRDAISEALSAFQNETSASGASPGSVINVTL
ncbi:MAG: hypothetical protein K6E16_06960 [Lachnospiraceae bacterium]|nr:hypothetical protein [Lachnospiraceae bacterium]